MIDRQEWQKAQKWENDWHGNCVNSFWEETKQIVYARRMGLDPQMILGKFPVYDLKGKSILDIGAGPYSILLKTINGGTLVAVDPCDYPEWIGERYKISNIQYKKVKGEDIKSDSVFDEVWIYNVLQHTDDPKKIIANARKVSKIVRLFEWIENGLHSGHIHNLEAGKLNEWLHGTGKIEDINESGCVGKCYYGIFLGDHYEKI